MIEMRHLRLMLTTATIGLCATPALAQTAAADDANKSTQTSTEKGDAAGNTAAKSEKDANGNDIIVTGVRASVRSALSIKRRADQVVDSIVAEDIGKFPDNTVSDSLQRVTGVQVQRGGGEASTVLIRGLPNIQSYINGREAFTGTFRGVALQDIPAELVAGIDVYKTATPQLIEGGVAGLIDIRLRRPFDFGNGTTFAGGGRALYGDQAKRWSYVGSALVSHTAQVGDGGRFGILVGASYNKRRYRDDTAFNFNFAPRFNNTGGAGQGTFYTNPANGQQLLFPQTTGVIYNVGDRTRPAINASVQYSPHPGLEFWADGLFTGYRERFDVNFFIGLPGQAEAPLASYTVVPGTNVVATERNLFNFTINSKQAYERKTDTYQFAGGVRATGGFFDLSSQFVYNKSTVKSRSAIVDVGYIPGAIDYNFNKDGTPFINLNGYNPANLTGPVGIITLFDGRSLATSRQLAWHGDAAHDFNGNLLKTLKFGARVTERKGQSDMANPSGYGVPFVNPSTLGASFLTLSPDGAVYGRSGIGQFQLPDSNFLLNQTDKLRAIAGRPNGAPPFDPNSSFRLKESTYAAYGQMSFDTGGSMPVDGVFGARLVQTDTDLFASQQFNGVVTPIIGKASYFDFLPSLSLRWHPTSNVQLRVVVGKSLTRQEFAQLNPATTLTQPGPTITGTGNGGNANLQPIRSNNLDVTAEWYFSKTGALTVAGFYRKLNGYVQSFVAPETLPGINGVPSTFQVTRPRNTNGKLQGFDIALTQFADFLPGALSGFGVQANFTYSKGTSTSATASGPITGISKYSYNIVGIYEKYGLSARLAYNWRSSFNGGFIASPITDHFQVKPLGFLDASLSYQLNKAITLTFDATNLTKTIYRDDFVAGIAPRDTRTYDRTFAGGVRFKF